MDRDFESILDECLMDVVGGMSVDECVARYPQHAARLRPLLEMAARVQAAPKPSPRPEAQTVTRQQFMARAAQLRQAQQPRRKGYRLKPLALAASLTLFLVVGSGFTTFAATKSQPDSFLYPVKLRLEEARLWLTFDDQARLELMLDRLEDRLGEMRWLLEHDKPVRGNVLAAIRSHNASVIADLTEAGVSPHLVERAESLLAQQEELLIAAWGRVPAVAQQQLAETMAGNYNVLLAIEKQRMPVEEDARAPIDPRDLAGGVVRIEGVVEQCCNARLWRIGGTDIAVVPATFVEDGSVNPTGHKVVVTAARGRDGNLRALRVDFADQSQQSEPPKFRLQGIVQEVADGRLQLGGWRVNVGARAQRLGALGRGHLVEVQGAVLGNGETRIDSIRSLAPKQAANRLIFEGTIERIEAVRGREVWTVSGQQFYISGAFIDAHTQPYAVGTRVQVDAERRGNELLAQHVVVLTGRGEADSVKAEGIVQETQAGLLLAGVPITVSSYASQPEPGAYIATRGKASSAGQIAVEQITVVTPGTLRLQGAIQRINDRLWIVAGVPIMLGRDAIVNGSPAVDARVAIWGSVSPQGGWVARYIDVLDTTTQR